MPPTPKPQTKTKEAEEGKEKAKEKKAKKAVVAVALLLLLVAAFVAAQNTQTGAQTGSGKMPDANTALSGFKTIGKGIVLGVRTAIAIAFWVAFAIMVVHFALGKVSPTRFQRLGAFWDGLERAKDIIYGYAWLFLLIFAIYAAIGIIVNGGDMDPKTFGEVVKWMMVDPINDLFREIQQSSQSGQGTGG